MISCSYNQVDNTTEYRIFFSIPSYRHVLPSGMTFISASTNTGDPCNLVNGDVVCEIGTIPPLGQGQTVVVEVRVRADQTGTFPNVAFLDNAPNDPNSTNNVSIVAVTVVSDISIPQPPQNPQDPGSDGDDSGTGGSNNNNGCAVAAGSINTSSTAINFALLLLPLLVFGFRSIKRKK